MVPASLSAMGAGGHPGLVIPDSRIVRRTGRFRIDLPRFAGVTIGQLSVLGRSVTSLKNLGAGRQMSRNARYDLAVANLRVAPVSSTGGNLCFADPHSDPASLLTAAGASMLHHSTAQSSGGPPLQHGPGPSCVRGYLELGYLDHNRGSWRRPARPGHRPGRTTSNDPARQLENGSQARSGREAAAVVS